jgi:hypothetical protein
MSDHLALIPGHTLVTVVPVTALAARIGWAQRVGSKSLAG